MSLETEITDLWTRYRNGLAAGEVGQSELDTLDAFLAALEAGEYRAANQVGPADWEAVPWVKRGVLLNFGLRETRPRSYGGVDYYDVLPLRSTDDLADRGARNTPDGTVLRPGSYVGEDVIMMSPSFVNIGAYVGDSALVDSNDVVGSCAQIGDGVKIGANTLVGGVLEPVEDTPVVVEDGVSLGAGCRVTSGFVVGENSVVGENTLLTPRIPVYDLVDEAVYYGRLPPERRAFQRYVESSVSEEELIPGTAYKPAVVATSLEQETLEATQREGTLRE
ncbi:MAG: 2,3,4,5-tetrahydropyridine-2,6-dicarboxylate N-succinyltransferase [Halolamina sp.]